MNKSRLEIANRSVAIWLLVGVGMIMVQVMLGGVTRLTESGLSITEWNPVTGVLPPLNDAAWQLEFEKYKHTDQFRYIHSDFTLSDFKHIFFWEWFHRLWARMMGMVFIVGFVYFLIKKKFKPEMILPFLILFLIGALQGAIGWIMVKSGLVPEKYFVGHVQLATHFVAALFLLIYTLWFALKLLMPKDEIFRKPGLRNFTLVIIFVLFLQLTYGAFMAGLKAASVAPSWPTMNGFWFPDSITEDMYGSRNLVDNPFMVQFIHRGLAYLLLILTICWFVAAKRSGGSHLFKKTTIVPMVLVFVQVVLGILTVINSPSATLLVWLGVIHQFVAMLFLLAWFWVLYLISGARMVTR